MSKQGLVVPYKNEQPLFYIACVISTLVWLGVLYFTKGAVLGLIPGIFLVYLFAQSAFVSYLKGTGALVSTRQFGDIQDSVEACARKTGMKRIPDIYVLHMDGMFNAFALRFLRREYIVLLSDIVDALEGKPDSLRFYIGHEMGHLHRKHTLWEIFLAPALVLPLLGAAYSRAREYTCDLYGAACCDSPESARLGLAALAVGGKKYKSLNQEAYLDQLKDVSGFWMSFHELIGNYPWLVKRFARAGGGNDVRIPERNPGAYLIAIFIPRLSLMSALVIYLAFIGFSMSSAMKQIETGRGQAEAEQSENYSEQEQPSYIVGEVYEGDPGHFFEYLGGDPSLDTSWKEVPPPAAPAQPEASSESTQPTQGE